MTQIAGYVIVALVLLAQEEPSTGLIGYYCPPTAITEICEYITGHQDANKTKQTTKKEKNILTTYFINNMGWCPRQG